MLFLLPVCVDMFADTMNFNHFFNFQAKQEKQGFMHSCWN